MRAFFIGHVDGIGMIIEAPHTGDTLKYQDLRSPYRSNSVIVRPQVLFDALKKTGQ